MHFGIARDIVQKPRQMKEFIEAMLISELKGLCFACLHSETCLYRKNTDKNIIQCEAFEPKDENPADEKLLRGLCKICERATSCNLPQRRTGAWRCNEFK